MLRELYLLPRGEQRALVGVTLLLILSLLIRLGVRVLPERTPAGVEEFEKQARAMMAFFVRADSLEQVQEDSLIRVRKPGMHLQTLDLNRSDSADLLPLPGIGPVFAGRIVKYRNLLGGFVSADQLAEVYGMPSATVERIRNQLYIDPSALRKLRLNSASFRELLRHPYLEFEDVKALVEYREFKGVISSPDELSDHLILSDSVLFRLRPYLDFNE